MPEIELPRAMSVTQMYNQKRNLLPFTGQWLDAFGKPELRGSWLVWGGSYQGKTSFILQLCKYLTKFEKVVYDTLEEGNAESFVLSMQDAKIEEVAGKIIFLDKEPIEILAHRLRRHKAPRIAVIDSLQYSQMSFKQYADLIKEFPNVLFIINCHADGKEPEGKVGKKIRYDAMVKIHVVGYVAFVRSRYIRGVSKPIVIYQEGAEGYYAGELEQILNPTK